jgi:hypothetical protein
LRTKNICRESKCKKEKSRLSSTGKRLRELAELSEYRADFAKIKGEILELFKRQKVPPDKDIFALSLIDGGGFVTVRQIQYILKEENINNYWIWIPPPYKDFGDRWGLKHFFDPHQACPGDFNPFTWNPIEFKYPDLLNLDDPDRFKMTIRYDIRLPLLNIKKSVERIIRHCQKVLLIETRAERYSDDDIYRVRKLLQDGLNSTEIFRTFYPEYKDFKFIKDYVIEGKTEKSLDAAAKLQWVKRLVKRARERKV